MNKKNQKGFTLVELIVVIAIVAILASVAIVGYTQFIGNARDTKAKSELDQIVNVLYAEAIVNGIYFSDDKVVEADVEGATKVVKTTEGKLEFIKISESQFAALLNEYAKDVKGKITLLGEKGNYKLQLEVGGGKGEVNILGTFAENFSGVIETDGTWGAIPPTEGQGQ